MYLGKVNLREATPSKDGAMNDLKDKLKGKTGTKALIISSAILVVVIIVLSKKIWKK